MRNMVPMAVKFVAAVAILAACAGGDPAKQTKRPDDAFLAIDENAETQVLQAPTDLCAMTEYRVAPPATAPDAVHIPCWSGR